MPSECKNLDPFKELKWSDLQDWAGGKATAKGIKYQEEERVKEIKRTSEFGLIAKVEGTTDYFTEISLANGKLSSICTCPVGHDCKHGVAAVLEYLELTEQGEEVLLVPEGDSFVVRARQGFTGTESHAHGEEEFSARELREYLQHLTKTELIEILVAFAEKDTLLGKYLKERRILATENVEEIVGEVYSELDELLEEIGNFEYPSYESDVPDFLDVQVGLESLLDAGHPDELLDIGTELMDRYEKIAEYDEEEIGTKISFCMDVVFEALVHSSLPDHEKMLYMLEIEMKDNYNILDKQAFWEKDFTPEEWRLFADALKIKLQEAEEVESSLYSSPWQRDYAVDRLIDALGKAGLSGEIVPICENEAEKTGNYVRLVRMLLDSGAKAKAEEWIYRGIKEVRGYEPDIARQLRQVLLEVREEEGKWDFVAALEAEEFFRSPDISGYLDVQETAKKIGKWTEVREAILGYLKSGELPASKVNNKKEEASVLPGVLPETGLLEIESFEKIKPPVLDLLIKIAIKDEDPQEVVHWYEELQNGGEKTEGYWRSVSESEIATSVKENYPEIALEVWKKLAERLISEAKVSSYEEAALYLRKIKEILESRGEKEAWKTYLIGIKEANRRKKKLLEILDKLGKDRIITP